MNYVINVEKCDAFRFYFSWILQGSIPAEGRDSDVKYCEHFNLSVHSLKVCVTEQSEATPVSK